MDIISVLYSTVGVVLLIGFIPQILRLIRTHTDCRDISISTWMIWNYTACVSLIYSIIVLPDLKFALVNAVNVMGVNSIIALTLYKRHIHKKNSRS